MFIVIHKFKDLEDKNEQVYKINDKFPADDREIDDDRIAELTTSDNKIGIPLIQYEGDKPEGSKPELDEEEMALDLTDLKQPKLKEIAKKLGITFKSIISNDELKRLIEEKRAEINPSKE